jgi:hypothetical protein
VLDLQRCLEIPFSNRSKRCFRLSPSYQKAYALSQSTLPDTSEGGRIITELSGKKTDSKPYARRSYLYVLADSKKLYTSTSGFVDLDIQKLKADLDAHAISQDQYNLRLNAILSGATESGVVKQ